MEFLQADSNGDAPGAKIECNREDTFNGSDQNHTGLKFYTAYADAYREVLHLNKNRSATFAGSVAFQGALDVQSDQSRTAHTGNIKGLLHLNAGIASGDLTTITLGETTSNEKPLTIIGCESNTGSEGSSLFFGTCSNYNNGVDTIAMYINRGKVGIGVALPDAPLEVESTATGYAVHIDKSHNAQGYGNGLAITSVDEWNDSIPFQVNTNTSTAGAGNSRFIVRADGKVGIGVTSPGYAFSVHNGAADYVAEFRNTNSGTPYKGITIQCGYVGANFVNTALQIKDGDGDEQGTITFTGGTVAYNTFTAGHFVELPSSDNDDGYDYGTLVETTEIFYTQVNNADSERGILYKVQKSSSAYSKGVLGVYSGKFDDKDNLHQVYVLGDGHILCNGEKGNIEVGDGICTSSTDGEGMKADKMAMIIGIAQEDVSFSGDESKLVAVQYGLQQFTPWE